MGLIAGVSVADRVGTVVTAGVFPKGRTVAFPILAAGFLGMSGQPPDRASPPTRALTPEDSGGIGGTHGGANALIGGQCPVTSGQRSVVGDRWLVTRGQRPVIGGWGAGGQRQVVSGW
jgi:hypothetical protein